MPWWVLRVLDKKFGHLRPMSLFHHNVNILMRLFRWFEIRYSFTSQRLTPLSPQPIHRLHRFTQPFFLGQKFSYPIHTLPVSVQVGG